MKNLAFVLALAATGALGYLLAATRAPDAPPTTTQVITPRGDDATTRTMIRATIREELRNAGVAAPPVVVETKPDVVEVATVTHAPAIRRGEEIIASAIAAGTWRQADRDAFELATRDVPSDHVVEVIRPLVKAINAQRVQSLPD